MATSDLGFIHPSSPCPPGIDKTERFPQEWHILAPRIRKIYRVPLEPKLKSRTSLDKSSPWRIFFDNEPGDVWSLLAKPEAILRRQAIPSTAPTRSANILSRLELLPAELIVLILADPSFNRRDIIALGLASKMLWMHALQHVEKDCWLSAAPMAGVEIACTGTYLRDFPPLFNNLAKSSVNISKCGHVCEERKINWGAIKTYSSVADPEKMWRAALGAHDNLATAISPSLAKNLAVELSSWCSSYRSSSPHAPWVLRNLTKREYIRCRPSPVSRDACGYVDHPDVAELRLDDVLLLRICWTRWPDIPNIEDLSLDVYRGPWAGNCFDIVPLKRNGMLAVGNGWKDSTDDVVKEAMIAAQKVVPWSFSNPSRSPRKRKPNAEG